MVSAARVGALVVLFVAMGIGALAILNQSLFGRKSTAYKVALQDAGGITPGSRVMMAGVLIGRVEKVYLAKENLAIADISVDEPHKIPEGSSAVLPSSLISIGDRELQIVSGPGRALAPGSTIPGSLKSPLDSFVPDAGKTVAALNETLTSVNALLKDPQLKASFTRLAASGEKVMNEGASTASKVGRLVDRMDGLAGQAGPKLNQILASSQKTMASIEAMTAELQKTLAGGEFQAQTLDLLKKLNAAAEEGRSLVAELNKTVMDPELQASLKRTTQNVSQMTESGAKVGKDFETISAEGITASKRVNDLLAKANSMADDVKKLLEQFKGTIDKLGGAKSDIFSKAVAEADIISSPDDGRIRTDLNLTLPVGKESLILGLYDAFESNRINLQYLRPMDESLAFRYGVYASKLGVGVDYRIAPNLAARGDLYGLNDPRLDLRMRYDFNRSLYGWFGVDRLFDRTSPIIGIGVRRRQ